MNDNEKAIEILENIDIEANNGYSKEDVEYACLMAILALGQQVNNGWIPVSERLPEKNGTYIVTQATHSLANHNKILRIDTETADFSNGIWRRAKHLEIIAWQPLPETYKEDADGNNNYKSM